MDKWMDILSQIVVPIQFLTLSHHDVYYLTATVTKLSQ